MADRPMKYEELVQQLGAPSLEGLQPVARQQQDLIVSAVGRGGDEPPQLDLEPIRIDDEVIGWQITTGDVEVGIRARAVEKPAMHRDRIVEIPGRVPEGQRPLARPIAGEPQPVRTLRRRSGRRVRPEYIFGADDRQTYFPLGYPWQCVGILWVRPLPTTAPGWLVRGTAALIGSRTIVTAAHMIQWLIWDLLDEAPRIRFTPAVFNGTSVVGLTSLVSHVVWNADHEQGDDVTAMRLVQPLGDKLGSFGVMTYDDDWEDEPYWTRCGYAASFGSVPERQTWFAIQDDDSDGDGWELEYEADTSGGDSGGPVFGWWDGVPCIIGVHSGGEEEAFDTNNVAAGGPFLTNMVQWAWDHWE